MLGLSPVSGKRQLYNKCRLHGTLDKTSDILKITFASNLALAKLRKLPLPEIFQSATVTSQAKPKRQ